MSTTTHMLDGVMPASAPDRAGLFQRVFGALIRARERQAARYVNAHLATLSTERLADLGFTPDQIAALRKHDAVVPYYWG